MATVKLWSDAEVDEVPRLKAVFDDIRATRKSSFVNNFWRGLCNDPALLERTWASLKAVMAPGALRPRRSSQRAKARTAAARRAIVAGAQPAA